MINPLRRLFEIGIFGAVNIHEGLWIAIDQRKPRALDLDHHAMAAAKGVIAILHGESYRSWLVGRKRLRLFQAVAEFAAHHVAADELLKTAHVHPGRVRIGIGIIARADIDHFYDPTGTGAGPRDLQIDPNPPR